MSFASTLPVPQSQQLALPSSGTQFLPVSGRITDRFLVTFRGDAERLAALVPEPFTLDVHQGVGFVSVCAVEILDMGIAGTPRFLRFDNREFLYRLGVRLEGEPTFITLRSHVSSPILALLGRFFSHYRPALSRVRLTRSQGRIRLEARTRRGDGDATLDVATDSAPSRHTSVFASEEEATRFLLGMKFSADVVRGRVRVQPIEHSPWFPRFVPAIGARFSFIEALQRKLGTPLVYDGTLATRDVHQTWKAARWL